MLRFWQSQRSGANVRLGSNRGNLASALVVLSLVCAAPIRAAEGDGTESPSAAALVQAVYDASAWVGAADSFMIRTRITVAETEKHWEWEKQHPPVGLFTQRTGNESYDARPYFIDETYAWDRQRIYIGSRSYRDGEESTKLRHYVRLWDGAMAVEWGAENNDPPQQMVLDNKTAVFFGKNPKLSNNWTLPWGCNRAYGIWWQDEKPEEYRAGEAIAPDDFELAGREEVNGRPCHVVESKAAHIRLHIGVADGRLYQREWRWASQKQKPFDNLALLQQVCGPAIKSEQFYSFWMMKQPLEEQRRIHYEVERAIYPHTVCAKRITLDDYREAAPDCWMPFHQDSESFNTDSAETFLTYRHDYAVQEVAVNRPLDDALFQYELRDGVRISTDWRFDPPINYTYHKDQTLEDLAKIAAEQGQKQAESKALLEGMQAVVKSRRGQTPPPLPTQGWLQSEPQTWEQLRNKVVVLCFWETNCGPCLSELQILGHWHEASEDDIVVIGVHPPTDDLEGVLKKLAAAKAEFPTIIEEATDATDNRGPLHHWFGNTWWPNSVLIDKQGAVAGFGRFLWGKPNLADEIRELLAKDE